MEPWYKMEGISTNSQQTEGSLVNGRAALFFVHLLNRVSSGISCIFNRPFERYKKT